MYPWILFWAPTLHFPFSGEVRQRIEPRTNWFTDHISGDAGDADIEKDAFEVASYGRQLGLLTEVLLDMADHQDMATDKGKVALDRIRQIQSQIEDLKQKHAAALVDSITADIETLKDRDPDAYELLRRKMVRKK